MVSVVDGLEHALQLPRGAAVDHQDKGDSDPVGQHILHRILIPLNVLVGFAWENPRNHRGGVSSVVLGGRFSDASPRKLFEGQSSHIGP